MVSVGRVFLPIFPVQRLDSVRVVRIAFPVDGICGPCLLCHTCQAVSALDGLCLCSGIPWFYQAMFGTSVGMLAAVALIFITNLRFTFAKLR
jgi:hypothetical protein